MSTTKKYKHFLIPVSTSVQLFSSEMWTNFHPANFEYILKTFQVSTIYNILIVLSYLNHKHILDKNKIQQEESEIQSNIVNLISVENNLFNNTSEQILKISDEKNNERNNETNNTIEENDEMSKEVNIIFFKF